MEKKEKIIKVKVRFKRYADIDGNWTKVCNDCFSLIPDTYFFKIYCFLCKNWNKDLNYAFPSIATISKECLISERKVKDGIKWLKENKFIQVEKFSTSNGYCSNIYRIRYPVIDREQLLESIQDEETEIDVKIEDEEEIEVEMKIVK
jgi:hypothetical protein